MSPELQRQETRLAFLVAAVVALLGTWLDMQVVLPHGPTVTLDRAAVWLAGLVAWWLVIFAVLRLARAHPAVPVLAAAAAAVVLAIHAQIEVTPVQTGSAALLFLILGAAAAGCARGDPSEAETEDRARRAWGAWTGTAAASVLAVAVATSAWMATTWQGHLRAAAETLAHIPDIRTRLSLPASDPDAERHQREALADLAGLAGRPLDVPEPWLTILQIERTPAAVDSLQQADAVFPEEWRVRRAAAWLLMDGASAARGVGRPELSESMVQQALEAMQLAGTADPARRPVGEVRAYATLLEGIAAATGDRDPLKRAVALSEGLAGRDPYSLAAALDLARNHAALDHPEQATRWARRALELNKLKRLDPGVHGLSAAELEEVRRLANP